MLPEEKLQNTGPEWFLILLDHIEIEAKSPAPILFMEGLASTKCENDAIHGNGTASVVGSARFIVSYWQSLLNIQHGRNEDAKRKAPEIANWKPKASVQKKNNRGNEEMDSTARWMCKIEY